MKICFVRFLLLTVAFISCLFPTALQGQKVALVLSGGGAKGGAHLGVIRALEENQVPISCIIGTSIGAIVGALYASGYTSAEMEQLLQSEDFQHWVSGILDEKYIYYYRKEDPNPSWITTDFDFTAKFTELLPTHLIKSHEIDFRLMELLSPSTAVCHENFDSLLVPFRCVVSDIDSTESLVLGKGDLSAAVRGSMSIPLVFNPVVIREKLVFDGGMYDNFPVEAAIREFHPDVIIGSRVAQRYDKPDRDDILSQLLTILMERQTDTILFPRSVMIVPNIPAINLLDFSKTARLADSGYTATLRKIPDIRKLVRDSISTTDLTCRRSAFKKREPAMLFDSIHITGLNKLQERYVRQILKQGRQVVNLEELQTRYFRFIDEGYIKSIFPIARYNTKTGYYDLYLDIRKTNRFGAQFGGNFSLGNVNEAFLQLQYRLLWTNAFRFTVNGYFGKVYNSAKADARIDFNTRKPWFAELNYTYNHLDYFKNGTFFFDDKTPNYVIEREYFGSIRVGMPVSNSGKLSLGINYAFTNDKYYQSNVFTRNDTADQTSFNFFSPLAAFELNSLNRKQFANAGVRLLLTLSYINGREDLLPGSTSANRNPVTQYHDWFKFRLLYDNYFESLGPVKFGFYGECVVSNQPLFANYTSSLLYASPFQPIPESQTYFLPAFRATNFAAAGLKIVVRIYKKFEYRLEGYLFQPYEQIRENHEDSTPYFGPKLTDRAWMASTLLVYNSPLGPISLGVNYYDKQIEPFSLNFNFGYILFNQRALP
ncbi:MAG TPA: patatin-like phospholipase family protein [Bacteroidales bacterium]|nr:patatin-like phospholipase family protein [Bacteroidales bacterium]HPT10584.1 patatin-like phospholipase family protein [Bacteroidales bacterium]